MLLVDLQRYIIAFDGDVILRYSVGEVLVVDELHPERARRPKDVVLQSHLLVGGEDQRLHPLLPVLPIRQRLRVRDPVGTCVEQSAELVDRGRLSRRRPGDELLVPFGVRGGDGQSLHGDTRADDSPWQRQRVLVPQVDVEQSQLEVVCLRSLTHHSKHSLTDDLRGETLEVAECLFGLGSGLVELLRLGESVELVGENALLDRLGTERGQVHRLDLQVHPVDENAYRTRRPVLRGYAVHGRGRSPALERGPGHHQLQPANPSVAKTQRRVESLQQRSAEGEVPQHDLAGPDSEAEVVLGELLHEVAQHLQKHVQQQSLRHESLSRQLGERPRTEGVECQLNNGRAHLLAPSTYCD